MAGEFKLEMARMDEIYHGMKINLALVYNNNTSATSILPPSPLHLVTISFFGIASITDSMPES